MVPLRVLSRISLAYLSSHSTLNSRPFNILQPLCRLQKSHLLWNQANPASFCKIPGVGVFPNFPALQSITSSLFFPLQLQILQLVLQNQSPTAPTGHATACHGSRALGSRSRVELEGGPVEGLAEDGVGVEQRELGGAQGVGGSAALAERGVHGVHELRRGGVVHFPERADDVVCAGAQER